MKRKDFSTLQSVYSILGMSLSRKNSLFIAGRFPNTDNSPIGECTYQTLKTENEDLIQDANLVYTRFLEMESRS